MNSADRFDLLWVRWCAIFVLTLACLPLAGTARADAFEIGPWVAIPVPGRDVGDSEVGIGAGVTATAMAHRVLGFGIDLGHHYWPVSPEFKAAFEKRTYFLAIDDPTWALSVTSLGVHVKTSAPLPGPLTPWMRLGVRFASVNPNLELLGTRLESKKENGWSATLGFDARSGANARIGFHASYDHLWSKENFGADFRGFTAGTHVLFGRW